VGYRYSRKTILFFVLTKNAGTTQLGEQYHMKYTNSYGNVCTCYVDRPEVISNYSAPLNTIDVHKFTQTRKEMDHAGSFLPPWQNP